MAGAFTPLGYDLDDEDSVYRAVRHATGAREGEFAAGLIAAYLREHPEREGAFRRRLARMGTAADSEPSHAPDRPSATPAGANVLLVCAGASVVGIIVMALANVARPQGLGGIGAPFELAGYVLERLWIPFALLAGGLAWRGLTGGRPRGSAGAGRLSLQEFAGPPQAQVIGPRITRERLRRWATTSSSVLWGAGACIVTGVCLLVGTFILNFLALVHVVPRMVVLSFWFVSVALIGIGGIGLIWGLVLHARGLFD